jgi:uncharacterized protein (DUF4415 family)
MPSACVVPSRKNTAAMPNKNDVLTPAELTEIGRRRAEARERARHLLQSMPRLGSEERGAEIDPENPPLGDDAVLRPAHEAHPHLVAARLRRGPGRPKALAPKRQVTLRLDPDVVEGLRATGPGWQGRVNEALRKWLKTG